VQDADTGCVCGVSTARCLPDRHHRTSLHTIIMQDLLWCALSAPVECLSYTCACVHLTCGLWCPSSLRRSPDGLLVWRRFTGAPDCRGWCLGSGATKRHDAVVIDVDLATGSQTMGRGCCVDARRPASSRHDCVGSAHHEFLQTGASCGVPWCEHSRVHERAIMFRCMRRCMRLVVWLRFLTTTDAGDRPIPVGGQPLPDAAAARARGPFLWVATSLWPDSQRHCVFPSRRGQRTSKGRVATPGGCCRPHCGTPTSDQREGCGTGGYRAVELVCVCVCVCVCCLLACLLACACLRACGALRCSKSPLYRLW